jgi:hypothetical protein
LACVPPFPFGWLGQRAKFVRLAMLDFLEKSERECCALYALIFSWNIASESGTRKPKVWWFFGTSVKLWQCHPVAPQGVVGLERCRIEKGERKHVEKRLVFVI